MLYYNTSSSVLCHRCTYCNFIDSFSAKKYKCVQTPGPKVITRKWGFLPHCNIEIYIYFDVAVVTFAPFKITIVI